MYNAYQPIYDGILAGAAPLKRPCVIGINGAYTSGKTVFAEGLEGYLRAQGVKTQLIHYDDFHHPFDTLSWTDETEIDVFYRHAFDAQKLVREVLAPLRAQGSLHKDVLCVNLGTNQFTNLVRLRIDADAVVLLEGVLLYLPPVVDYIDYRVYLDISSEEILRRGERRDVPRFGAAILEKFATRYIPVQERYMAECDPVAAADFVVDNGDFEMPRIIGKANGD